MVTKEKGVAVEKILFQISINEQGDLKWWAPEDLRLTQAVLVEGALAAGLRALREEIDGVLHDED